MRVRLAAPRRFGFAAIAPRTAARFEDAQRQRSLDGALQRSGREHRGAVEKSAGDGGDGDRVDEFDVFGAEGRGAVHDDARAAPAAAGGRDRHVDRGAGARPKCVERGRCEVAQHRAWTE